MNMSRPNHFADIIYRKHLSDAPRLVHKISETVPGFPEFFCHYYAMEEAGACTKTRRPGKVYFMRDADNGDVKIGFSEDNVDARARRHADTRQSDVVTLLCINGSYQDETAFHYMYSPYNKKIEWYIGSAPVLSSIDAMKHLAETAPDASVADFMEAARWELLFYTKEADYYKAFFAGK